MTRPLICMACSATKDPSPEPMLGLGRYDGPMWKTLRAALVNVRELPDIWVLSAKYGFLRADQIEIPVYEQRMTEQLAEKIARLPQYEPQVFAFNVEAAGPVLFAGGQLYRSTMFRAAPRRLDIAATDGSGVGYQREQLRKWIEGNCR